MKLQLIDKTRRLFWIGSTTDPAAPLITSQQVNTCIAGLFYSGVLHEMSEQKLADLLTELHLTPDGFARRLSAIVAEAKHQFIKPIEP